MRRYDFIIAGGGAAGLSLACHLMQSPSRDSRILIIDQEAKDQNDRTWCFWANHSTLFDEIISRSWVQLQVFGKSLALTVNLRPYRYNLIRGIDFYTFAHQRLSRSPQVDLLRGKVEHIEDGEREAGILVNGQRYVGAWVFTSLFNGAAFKPNQTYYRSLKQQFTGWEIETPEQHFTPQAPTLLDFRAGQERGAHFLYVLPFSECHALVESVLCTSAPVSWEVCEQALRCYLANVQGIDVYSIRRTEQGISPLTDWPFRRRIGQHIMTIGTLGGRVKPSTGYAFMRIQQDSAAIVRSLLQVGHPFRVPPTPRRYRYFDSVLLETMRQHGEQVESIFTTLFQHNSAERIFRLLDEDAPWWENGLMIPTLPPQLLWQALRHIRAARRV